MTNKDKFERWHKSVYRNCDYLYDKNRGYNHARISLDFDIWVAAIGSIQDYKVNYKEMYENCSSQMQAIHEANAVAYEEALGETK